MVADKGQTLTEQVIDVLREAYPESMHYTEVTDVLIDRGAWEMLPETPQYTIGRTLSTQVSGSNAHFVRTGKFGTGMYRIRAKHLL